jgi:hypothetical protein
MPSSTPYFSIAASVSPPPASENALLRRSPGERRGCPRRTGRTRTRRRAVPDDGAGLLEDRASARRVRADVEDHLVGPRRRRPASRRLGASRRTPRHDHVGRQRDLGAASPRLRASRRCAMSSMSGSAGDLPTARRWRSRKVLAMPPPTISCRPSEQRLEHVELGRHLGAGDDRDQRRAGFSSARSSASSSPASSGPAQATGAKRATPCVLASARCAVPNASITNTSHSAAILLRERFVVLLLALVEAHVLAAARPRPAAHVDAVEPVATSGTGGPSSSESRARPAPARTPRIEHALLRAGRGATSRSRARLRRAPPDRRQRGADARVARDRPSLHGHVQVLADQHALAAQVEVGHAFETSSGRLTAAFISASRRRVEHAVREAPLVVVPRADLHQPCRR